MNLPRPVQADGQEEVMLLKVFCNLLGKQRGIGCYRKVQLFSGENIPINVLRKNFDFVSF